MSVRLRWPMLLFGWVLAVAVTALVAWRAVHFVGGQLSSELAISRPRAAAPPAAVGPGRGPVVPGSSVPTADQPGPGTPPSPERDAPESDAPQPAPRPQPVDPPDPDVDPDPVVALPVGPRTPPRSPPGGTTVEVSDRRAVDTAGGSATFTCTQVDVVALETAQPAPGYQLTSIPSGEDSRMDVFFVAPTEEERIDARCEDGKVDASVN